MLESLRGLGYAPPTALADLVDNSIAAKARDVAVHLEWAGPESWVRIVDDGEGMDDATLEAGMRLGARDPRAERAATDLGLSIPRDLSVVGYDNLPLDDYTVPRLTSVSQQSDRIGRDMMSRLADRIADPSTEPIVRTYPQELVVRESTGPAKK